LNPVPLRLQSGVLYVTDGYMFGDLNGNRAVQAVDAYIALQIASGAVTPAAEQLLAGDVNGNGAVDAGDATMILYYAVNGTWPLPSVQREAVKSTHGKSANNVLLRLDDVSGAPGATVQTTLRAENLVDWAGGEFLLAYDHGVIDSIAKVEASDLASSFALQYHDDGAGLLHIALADDAPISGSGSLATISLHIAPVSSAGSNATLALVDAHLNDIAGRDFATSVLQQTIVRSSADLQVTFSIYLPVVLK
jgi:hypothetical protein